jgi:hypothetical protein
VGYPNITNEAEVNTSPSNDFVSKVNLQTKSEINVLSHSSENQDSQPLKSDAGIPKKRNPLLG